MRTACFLLLVTSACTGSGSDGAPARANAALANTSGGAFHQTARRMLPGSLDAIAEARATPLLLPSPYAEATLAMAGPNWFALSYRDPEHTISLHASQGIHAQVAGEPELGRLLVHGTPAATTVNEGIRALTWRSAATHYALEVECLHPFEDRRCTSPDYALAVANSLIALEDQDCLGGQECPGEQE